VPITLLESDDIAWYRDAFGAARGVASALALRIGLGEQRSADVALAVSEVASNLHKHAVEGALLLRVVRTEAHAGIEVLAVDRGPGIADVAEAMRDGISPVGSLGIGLGAVARAADVFDLDSSSDRGTILAARFWAADGAPDRSEPAAAGVTRPISGEQVCGDAWSARLDEGPDGPALLLMLCDGLGHGPMASLAAAAAVKAFREARPGPPAQMVQELHRALRGTRGAALAVACVEPEPARVRLCGVGNTAAVLVGAGSRAALLSMPGIVGHHLPSLRTFEQPLVPRSVLVMHSDGVNTRWGADVVGGFPRRIPVVIAARLLREAAVRRDDASVAVASGPW
jgi:anti-sigma regulatory factor (Ser/Thr protein kinase)